MAVAFSEEEKRFINDKLKEAARECLSRYGVKKTTVDQLVQMAGIAKGSFYKFYDSKEILFFTVLEDYRKSLLEGLADSLKSEEDLNADKFSELIYELYQKVRHSFIINIVKDNEMEYLMRKLPKELILKHHLFDLHFASEIFLYVKIKEGVSLEVVTASLRAIFMSMLHIEEVGAKNFDDALKLLIRGLAVQVLEGELEND